MLTNDPYHITDVVSAISSTIVVDISIHARRALPARLDRLFIHSLPFGARGGTRTRRAEPGFPESRASSAKKRKNVSSLFERRGFFFFVKTARVPASNPAP